MKKRLQINIAVFAMIALMFSCSTSNDVAGKRGIQKRKYNKGFYIDFDKKLGNHSNQNEVVVTEVEEEENDIVQEEQTPLRDLKKEVVYAQDNAAEIIDPIQEINVNETVIEPATTITNRNTNTDRIKIEESDKSAFKIIKSERKFLKQEFKTQKRTKLSKEKTSDDAILYYILAILIPFLAVGLVTDWDLTKVIICLLLCILFWLPGMIYALIVVSNNV